MRKGLCIDCGEIAMIKAKNRCEHHYRQYYYLTHREQELAYAAKRRKECREASVKRSEGYSLKRKQSLLLWEAYCDEKQ